ncbi:MAG: methyltransferase domain-containing protein [Planctomycetota bacterium]|nr:methyltransferase domain-containing protein [Planctomycetota bacterium]
MRLHLGCGLLVHPDWVNVDLVAYDPAVRALDLTRPLPYADEACTAVYHAHLLEHLRRENAEPFLRECRRVLAPGGILRVVVPDLESWCRLYLERLEAAARGDAGAAADHEYLLIELLDSMVRERSGGAWAQYMAQPDLPNRAFVEDRAGRSSFDFLDYLHGRREPPKAVATTAVPPDRKEQKRLRQLDKHLSDAERAMFALHHFRESGELHRWMYDRVSLGRLLETTGFTDATVRAASESEIPDWAGYAFEHDEEGAERRPGSLYMEARRPAS